MGAPVKMRAALPGASGAPTPASCATPHRRPAELPAADKNRLSHRGQALRALVEEVPHAVIHDDLASFAQQLIQRERHSRGETLNRCLKMRLKCARSVNPQAKAISPACVKSSMVVSRVSVMTTLVARFRDSFRR